MVVSTMNKASISRWQKVFTKEKGRIINTDEGFRLKALLCGFLAGDGCLEIRKEKKSGHIHYDVRFFPDDSIMQKAYCDAIKYVYGKEPKITKKGSITCVRVLSKTVVEDLFSYANFGIYKWSIPLKLFSVHGSKESWLRGFFSAEGYVGPRHIKVQTVNKEGIKGVSALLSELKISHGCYTYTPKKPNHSIVNIIMIHTKEARNIFYKKIGFDHYKKSCALKKSLGMEITKQ